MAFGNKILVTANPKGVFLEGIISGTPKPGTCMEISGFSNGKFTFRAYQPGTDGERRTVIVLLEDDLQGKLATTAYADGDWARLYCPIMGEELNCLLADVAGTGDDHTQLETLIINNGDGKLIATTGSPESEPFRLLEATITDPTADQLVHVMYTGY